MNGRGNAVNAPFGLGIWSDIWHPGDWNFPIDAFGSILRGLFFGPLMALVNGFLAVSGRAKTMRIPADH
ncbi:MAG: hypothetical protein A2Z99_10995 [Treponema sp. GWB1_62_6]|nr:MAG: hypothetical protein A2Z99_10995 [Treponema sp. GWB1_62_6]OHE68674.1 MAG: hypothetical protein A2001_06110 [Treponema sp. GWC1_61_84]HCM26630.1 hypothetical protein [Treponema sp.]